MGIPKLTQTLQPFAERVILGAHSSKNNDQQNRSPISSIPKVTSVVIDGPSMVYHIYHRLISVKTQSLTPFNHRSLSPKSRHPLLFQSTYAEINHAVLTFIIYLQSKLGVEVQKIYFDGGLPASKRDVRLARLEDGRRKLSQFRELHGNLSSGFNGGWRDAYDGSFVPASTLLSSDADEKDELEGNASRRAGCINPECLFVSAPPLPSSLKLLPPPPFMVPAAIEHLRSHLPPPTVNAAQHRRPQKPGSSLIHMAPAEADDYCALHARRTGAAILTSDSDLLVYDLGLNGSVLFFKSLELSPDSSIISGSKFVEQETPVFGTRYHAPSIASKLNLPGRNAGGTPLQRFCFERSRDASHSTLELKRRCLGTLSTSEEGHYKEFLQHYSTDHILLPDGDKGREIGAMQSQRSSRVFPGLDPRLAELVVLFQQLRSPARTENMESRSRTDDHQKDEIDEYDEDGDREMFDLVEQDLDIDLPIFLPPVIEDPSRDSAWSYGREIRKLAYGLLGRVFVPARDPTLSGTTTGEGKKRGKVEQLRITEYHRRGTRIAGVPIDFPSSFRNLEVHIQNLLDSIHSHGQHESQQISSPSNCISKSFPVSPALPPALIPSSRFWHPFALTLLTVQRLHNSKPAPSSAFADGYLLNHACVPKSWDDVHDQASLEAVLYSLRMLKQTASLVAEYAYREDRDQFRALAEALESLPPISELMDPAFNNISNQSHDLDPTTQTITPGAQLSPNGNGESASVRQQPSADPQGSWVLMDGTSRKGTARMKRTRPEIGSQGKRRKDVTREKGSERRGVGGKGENTFTALEEVEW